MARILTEKVPHHQLDFIFSKALNYISDKLIDLINDFITNEVEEEFEFLHFKINLEKEKIDQTQIWLYLESDEEFIFSGNSRPFFTDFKSLPLMSPELIRETGSSFNIEELFLKWFSECWWKAGGWYYPKPAALFIGGDLILGSVILTKKKL